MLIKALCDYYDILRKAEEIPRRGYHNIDISFGIAITPEGELDDVIDMRKKEIKKLENGKKKSKLVPLQSLFPDEQTISGVKSIVLDYRPEYIFGLVLNKDKNAFELAISKKGESKHKSYVERNLSFIEGIDNPLANGFHKFLTKWNPEKEKTNKQLMQIIKEYSASKMEIFLAGKPSAPLQDDKNILSRWEQEYNYSYADGNERDVNKSICAITGEYEVIERKTHDKIAGMGGAMGAPLISVNKPSMESYGNTQGENSSISVTAMKKYTSTLNYLKKSPLHHQKIIDTDVFYWAMNNSEREVSFFNALCMGRNNEKMDVDQVNMAIEGMISDAKRGDLIRKRMDNADMFDPKVTFFIVGMNASQSRISLEWIIKDEFAKIVKNVTEFQNDLMLVQGEKPIAIWTLLSSMGSTKSKEVSVPSPMVAKTYSSVFKGEMLPCSMLDIAVRRCKNDFKDNDDKGDDTKKIYRITETRMRAIKAYIIRNNRKNNEKEEFGMSLDVSNTNPYYVCGRLFAVMEKIQFDGDPKLNRTIKDAYFSAAASTPATIMPKLITLNGHHMKKLKEDSQRYYAILMQSIIDNLDEYFPKTASIEDQGRFMIGYFQQRKDLYTSRK